MKEGYHSGNKHVAERNGSIHEFNMMRICTVYLAKQKICNVLCCIPLEAVSHATRLYIAGSPIKVSNYISIGLQNIGCDHWSREIYLELSVMSGRNNVAVYSCIRNNFVFLM